MRLISTAPAILGRAELVASEMCFVQYMPVKMPHTDIRIPHRLGWCRPLADSAPCGVDDYLYLTAKSMFVDSANMGNRKGWHIDGFLSDDVNVIWYDCAPTEFCIQEFDIDHSHEVSLAQMATQARAECIATYRCGSILLLSNKVVHRVSEQPFSGMRTFVKISVSKNKYNLRGNAKNELFEYDWDMFPRGQSRNHPTVNNERAKESLK